MELSRGPPEEDGGGGEALPIQEAPCRRAPLRQDARRRYDRSPGAVTTAAGRRYDSRRAPLTFMLLILPMVVIVGISFIMTFLIALRVPILEVPTCLLRLPAQTLEFPVVRT